MPLFEVKNLTVYYGSVLALDNVSFHIDEGEIVAMIGPNGAGKSTALKAICGLVKLNGRSSGRITFEGKDITGLQPYELVKKGICLVPEDRRVFGSMSVLENLQMGGFSLNDKKKLENSLRTVFNLFPKLEERMYQKSGTLSTGEQQMLSFGRALMLEPRLLLVDEPSVGLSPNYVQLVFEKLKEIKKRGTTVLLVEQNAKTALQYSDRSYVFDLGNVVIGGSSKDLLENGRVKESFIGA